MDYSPIDKLVIKELKSAIKRMEKEYDQHETPDEVAMDLAGFYRVLEYYLCYPDYELFIEKRKAKRNRKESE